MAELWVGAGKPFAKLADAVSAAASGDTIFVQAGTYTNDFSTIYKDLKIVGVGGMAHFTNTTMIPNGKAIFVVNADVTFEKVEFSGAKVWDSNGAGIRYESGDLIVRDSYFHDNQNGILAASNLAGTITIERSEFARNGAGDGQTHGVYVNGLAKLTVIDSYFHDTSIGHHLKSRASVTEVRGTTLDDGALNSSYSIDLPNGGAATIAGNTLIQGASAGNKYMIHYGGEVATPAPGAVSIEGNTFINYRSAGGVGVLNQTSKSIDLKENAFYGVNIDAEGGPIVRADNAVGVLGKAGAQSIVGGAGLDKIDYRFSPAAVTVDLAAGSASDGYGSVDTLSGVEQVGGSRFADAISGNGLANRLDGGDGNDRISGAGGDDLLMGGRGDDLIDGGAGVDTALYAGKAADYRVSLSGGEVVVEALNGGREGVDRLTGVEKLRFADAVVNAPAAPVNDAPTAGADQASTPRGQAVVIDVLANDADANGDALQVSALGAPQHGTTQLGANGRVTYAPTAGYVGADSFTYQVSDGKGGLATGSVALTVTPVNDAPTAGADQASTPRGQAVVIDVLANDADANGDALFISRIVAAPGHGSAAAVDGKIVYTPAAGYSGADVFTYEASDGKGGVATASVSLTVEAPPPPPPDPVGVTLVGSGGKDMLKGGALADAIDGAGGNDVLYGYGGDDRLVGGDGADMVYGGDGADILLGGEGNDRLQGDAGDDVLDGGAGTDTLYGGDGADTFVASGGGDKYYGGAGIDSLVGGAGDDAILLTSFAPSNAVEIVDGKGGANAIVGDALSNLLDFRATSLVNIARIEGGAGNDRIFGSSGADAIFGGDGSDTLNGGAGSDRLTGGSGADLFVFERGCGADVVTDFRSGGQSGVIDLRDFDLAGFDALRALCSESGGSVAIDLPGADSVTLQGWRLADLATGQFLL